MPKYIGIGAPAYVHWCALSQGEKAISVSIQSFSAIGDDQTIGDRQAGIKTNRE